jgi:hypothetical protein
VFKRREVKSISRHDDMPILFKAKKEKDERIVGAAVLIPGVADHHGTIYKEAVVRRAAYYFMEHYLTDNAHGINVMHKDKIIERAIKVIESFVIDRKMTYKVDVPKAAKGHLSKKRKKVTYPKGTWLMYSRVLNDTLWEGIKSGKYTGWSPEGLGEMKPLKDAA